ncbi:RsmB/NOP family class I SAM-dependent RNA methyltransferase [Crenobacter cavernae]|uniref:RsmB/NOP family class I SAM-dependent RNA methyltransferase n=1 Tax=Crenobacter cavernae TaxID=2290923 RepID=A0A345Y312_9NEIS|nr:RsmB/NOP family class I SAM-dependent RNA methyltransferase [Crenobacter cavernae]AXK38314.1 RsmB/NOP family class I SAM-dependent RNA methyltransferase [Crenobacter cavernae]
MSLKAPQLKHLVEVITRMTAFDRPADAVLSAYFRENTKLGAQDRHLIAETAFACLRRHAMMSALCAPHPTSRKLALATLVRVRGMNLRELEDADLSKAELAWIAELKGKAPELDLAGQTELPAWVIERLGTDNEDDIRALAKGLMESAPLDLRVNTLKMKRDAVLESLRAGGFEAEPTPFSPIGIRMKGKPALNRHPLFLEGAFEIQDEGSQLLGLIIGARRGEMVVDFCAGAGGKTLLLGAQMASTGRLYAFDVSEKRLANLKPRLARSGLSNVHPQLIAHENDARIKRLAGKVDRVLVDAPCSGLGTLRRNPDLKFRQSPASVDRLSAMQASILESAARLVKVGGRLVYATCSVLPQENRAVVNAFLDAHPEFELVPMNTLLAEHKIALDTGNFLEMAPHKHNTDGFFAAALTRKA